MHRYIRKNFFPMQVGDQALEQIAKKARGISLTGSTQELSGHNPVPWDE